MSSKKSPGAPRAPGRPGELPTADGNEAPPWRDLGGAIFFAIWPALGWWAIAGDPYLWSDFGADPGPDLMPSIVLGLLSFGSLLMLARAGLAFWRTWRGRPRESLFTRLGTPAVFAVTLVLFVPAMQWIGFLPAGVIFAGGWMLALRDSMRGHSGKRIAVEVAAATAIGVGLIHVVFVRIINVPLP